MQITVTNSATLSSAIGSARGGDTILLAPGQYDFVSIYGRNPTSNVTIESSDPNNQAILHGATFESSSHFTFENLTFQSNLASGGTLTIRASHDFVVDHVTSVLNDGAIGVSVDASNHLTVENSDISHAGIGITHRNSDTVLIASNNIHKITVDGIDGGGSSNITITGNTLEDFTPGPGTHPDAIQFWTTNTSSSAHDIVITNNIITRGTGNVAQGIFMNNEWSQQYHNVTIAHNAIVGGMYNGIYVENADGVKIDSNLVQGYQDMTSWIFLHNGSNSSVTNNEATGYQISNSNPGLVTSGNTNIAQAPIGDPTILQQWLASHGASINALPFAGAAETLTASAAGSKLQGGSGDDSIVGGSGEDYLRGGAGNDQMVGGAGFDDMNGNEGNDTLSGGAGNDWVVGGKGNDSLSGDDGNDLVLGNLGDDTLDGGLGNDIIRGGRGDDVLMGGAGNDWLSGDLGNDTMTGGAGADTFHSFAGAGIDRVTDFNFSDGDRVQLDPGTIYTIAQVGSDTVVTIGAGDQLILVGIHMVSLPTGWLFE